MIFKKNLVLLLEISIGAINSRTYIWYIQIHTHRFWRLSEMIKRTQINFCPWNVPFISFNHIASVVFIANEFDLFRSKLFLSENFQVDFGEFIEAPSWEWLFENGSICSGDLFYELQTIFEYIWRICEKP